MLNSGPSGGGPYKVVIDIRHMGSANDSMVWAEDVRASSCMEALASVLLKTSWVLDTLAKLQHEAQKSRQFFRGGA